MAYLVAYSSSTAKYDPAPKKPPSVVLKARGPSRHTASTYCAGVPCHANTMLQGGEAPRLVRSNTLFSLLRPATQAASARLAGRSMGLLLRLLASRRNRSKYVAMRAPPNSTRLTRLMLTPGSARRTRARTKLEKSEDRGSSRS
jgi:hypothetical protein